MNSIPVQAGRDYFSKWDVETDIFVSWKECNSAASQSCGRSLHGRRSWRTKVTSQILSKIWALECRLKMGLIKIPRARNVQSWTRRSNLLPLKYLKICSNVSSASARCRYTSNELLLFKSSSGVEFGAWSIVYEDLTRCMILIFWKKL